MKWNRSETIALAPNSCTRCKGLGLRLESQGGMTPCNCVLRAIFRACWAHFRHCAVKERCITCVSLDTVPAGREGRHIWGLKDEEYMADFILVSQRTLTAEDYVLFKYHFLLGADFKLCCRKLGIDRGTLFHTIYRIEHTLGRVFRELEPYSLFPIDEYYNGPRREHAAEPVPRPETPRRIELRSIEMRMLLRASA